MPSNRNRTPFSTRIVRFSLVAVVLLLVSGDVRAQSDLATGFDNGETQGVSYHRFVRPGDVPMQVEVLGLVRSPGLYEVNLETDVSRLLALAGGISEGLRSSGENVSLRVNLYRKAGDQQNLIYTVPLDSMFVTNRPPPPLMDGDVLNVSGKVERAFSWRDTLSIATSAAALALFIERLIRIAG